MAKDPPTKTTVINQTFAPSFGRYELARIALPGFYFALLALVFFEVFLRQFIPAGWTGWHLGVLFAGTVLIAGLTMYAKETPKRRRAFLENQPSQYLSSKSRTMKDLPLLDETEARRLYFYILNNYIPSTFHEKIFFFGMIYYVMIQMRRTSFWFALAGSVAVLLKVSMGMSLPDQQGLLLFTLLVWMIYLLNIRYNKADRKMQENYQDQIFWMDMNSNLIESILRRRQASPPVS